MLKTRLPVVAGLLLTAASLMGDPVVATGGQFNPLPACTSGAPGCPAPSGTPFWFNPSQDDGVLQLVNGEPRNLASILNGTSPYGSMPVFTGGAWYGNSDNTSAVQNLYFSGASSYNVTLLLRETGNNLILGWYSFDEGGITGGGVLVDGSVAAFNTVQFTPASANFGFFLKYGRPSDCVANDWRAVCSGTIVDHAGGTGVPLDIYYSQSALNSSSLHPASGAPPNAYYEADLEANRQHFLAVTTNQGLLLGVEDGWSSQQQYGTLNTQFAGNVWERQGDYNDLVVLITEVPEPSTLAFLGLGMAGLAFYRFRRRG